ncbi:MAG: tetratricopeptide repeat protein, partial [Comamonadaceae bacterium]
MSVARKNFPGSLGLAVLTAALLAGSGLVRADEYGDVNQLLRSGKLPEALTKADQYLAGKPKDPQMRFLKGVIQTETGKTSDAIVTFTRLTEDYPELPEPYNNLAVLYAGQSQFDKARAALEMAIRTNPSYATAHENLGDVYAKLASQAYSRALQLDAGNTAVQPKLALIRELFSAGPRQAGASVAARPGTTVAVASPPATRP